MTGPPLISIIVPTFRRPALLRETLNSVLGQTFRDIEVLVVEDGSHDAAPLVRECGGHVRYFWQSNQGVSQARNTGARLASGEWLAFVDDDDLWDPTKLERQIRFVEQSPQMAMVHTDHWLLRDGALVPGTRPVPEVPSGRIGPELFLHNFVVTSSVMLRRSVFMSVGGFDPRYSMAEDYDLWLRVSLAHEIGFVGERVTIFRDHSTASDDPCRMLAGCAGMLSEFVAAHPAIRARYGTGVVQRRLAQIHWQAGYAHFAAGRHRAARRFFVEAWRHRPAALRPLFYGAVCAGGPRGVRMIGALRRVRP